MCLLCCLFCVIRQYIRRSVTPHQQRAASQVYRPQCTRCLRKYFQVKAYKAGSDSHVIKYFVLQQTERSYPVFILIDPLLLFLIPRSHFYGFPLEFSARFHLTSAHNSAHNYPTPPLSYKLNANRHQLIVPVSKACISRSHYSVILQPFVFISVFF